MSKFWNYVKLCIVLASQNANNMNTNNSSFNQANEYYKNNLQK